MPQQSTVSTGQTDDEIQATKAAEAAQAAAAQAQEDADQAQQQGMQKAPQQPQASIFITSPAELSRKYSDNEVATDQALAGKIIQITAPVKSIDKDFTDTAVLKFAVDDNEFDDMSADLDDTEKDQAAHLSKGQVVTVQCKKVRRIMNSPVGSGCVFVDNPSAPAAASTTAAAQSVQSAPTPAADSTAATSPPIVAQASVPTQSTEQAPSSTAVTQTRDGGSDELKAYATALQGAIYQQWIQPKNLPTGSCVVHIEQLPGGTVVSAKVDDSCPYNDQDRASIENAIWSAQPLPYKGFENVFQREINFTFVP